MSKQWLIIDGYNALHYIPEFRKYISGDIEEGRHQLIDLVSNYQGYHGGKVTLVFDAHKTARIAKDRSAYRNIEIIFSRKNETADSVIEKMVYESDDKDSICVVTSDRVFRMTVFGMRVQVMTVEIFLKAIALEMKETWQRVKMDAYKPLNNRVWTD